MLSTIVLKVVFIPTKKLFVNLSVRDKTGITSVIPNKAQNCPRNFHGNKTLLTLSFITRKLLGHFELCPALLYKIVSSSYFPGEELFVTLFWFIANLHIVQTFFSDRNSLKIVQSGWNPPSPLGFILVSTSTKSKTHQLITNCSSVHYDGDTNLLHHPYENVGK